jgi:hypothetical protein
MLVSGSVYANNAPTSLISWRYTARTSGGNFFASACSPCAAVNALVNVTPGETLLPPVPLLVVEGATAVRLCVETCIDEVRLEMEEAGEEGELGARFLNDSMNDWICRLSLTWAGTVECERTGTECFVPDAEVDGAGISTMMCGSQPERTGQGHYRSLGRPRLPSQDGMIRAIRTRRHRDSLVEDSREVRIEHLDRAHDGSIENQVEDDCVVSDILPEPTGSSMCKDSAACFGPIEHENATWQGRSRARTSGLHVPLRCSIDSSSESVNNRSLFRSFCTPPKSSSFPFASVFPSTSIASPTPSSLAAAPASLGSPGVGVRRGRG